MMPNEPLKNQLGLADETEVAELRGMKIISLRNERARGKGPPYQRLGKKVFYPVKELQRFLIANTVKPKPRATLISGEPGVSRQRA